MLQRLCVVVSQNTWRRHTVNKRAYERALCMHIIYACFYTLYVELSSNWMTKWYILLALISFVCDCLCGKQHRRITCMRIGSSCIGWYSCVQVDKITFIRGNTDPALCCGSNAAYCLSSCSKVLAEALAIAYWSFTHAANQTLIDDRGRHCSLRFGTILHHAPRGSNVTFPLLKAFTPGWRQLLNPLGTLLASAKAPLAFTNYY